MSQETMLPEYKLILNATDGSVVSERATHHAIHLAKLTGAELLILHVVETNLAWYAGAFYEQVVDELRDFGDKVFEGAMETVGHHGVKARSMMMDGHSGVVIVRLAEREKVDLIVMGALGKTMVEEALLGSVSRHVVRHASCPVLVVK